LLPHALALRKVTIIPRGMAGGVTWYLEEDNYFLSESQFCDLIASTLGGRISEEIVFGEITTGASDDLRKVTKMARAMVTQYGMSPALGARVYGEKQEMVFLGREISEQRDYSDAVAEQIDNEVRQIIDTQYGRARKILEENRPTLERIAQRLLDVETLEADEFAALVEGEDTQAPVPTSTPPQKPSETEEAAKDDDRREWKPPSLDLPPAPTPA
jgi:cell division protease FtsH